VHHSAINARDVDASLRFYRDGLGLEVMMDTEFDGDWPTVFGASTTRLRSVFLGDPATPDAGIVELVHFASVGSAPQAPPPASRVGKAARDAGMPDGPQPVDALQTGFFLLSLYVQDTDAVLARLQGLGLGGPPRRIELPGPDDSSVVLATVRDPNGVLVELIGR
jgi:catechol 2,3-dioxygenase-like lactoylglutathione lyase family enzyme